MINEVQESTDLSACLEEKGVYVISLPTPFPVGPVNVFLFVGDRPVLVDTGMKTDESQRLLTEKLAEHGVKPRDLGAILLTHGHSDHMGCVSELQKLTDAPVYAHPLVKQQGLDEGKGGEERKRFLTEIMKEFGVPEDVIEEANSFFNQFRRYRETFTVQHVLEDGQEAEGFRAHFVPGHSPSDVLFVHEELGVAVLGDHILPGTNVNALLREPHHGKTRGKSLVEYRASLRLTQSLDLDICLPGHGDPFEGHVEAIDDIFSRHARRSELVLKMVRGGRTTPYAVSRKLFPSLDQRHLRNGLSVAVGHMEVLEEAGAFGSEHRDGVLHFFER